MDTKKLESKKWNVDKFNCEKCYCQFVSRYVTGFEPRYCVVCYEDTYTCEWCHQEFESRDISLHGNHRTNLCRGCAFSRRERKNKK